MKLLYKAGTTKEIWGVMVDFKAFKEDEIAAAKKAGWKESPAECKKK